MMVVLPSVLFFYGFFLSVLLYSHHQTSLPSSALPLSIPCGCVYLYICWLKKYKITGRNWSKFIVKWQRFDGKRKEKWFLLGLFFIISHALQSTHTQSIWSFLFLSSLSLFLLSMLNFSTIKTWDNDVRRKVYLI